MLARGTSAVGLGTVALGLALACGGESLEVRERQLPAVAAGGGGGGAGSAGERATAGGRGGEPNGEGSVGGTGVRATGGASGAGGGGAQASSSGGVTGDGGRGAGTGAAGAPAGVSTGGAGASAGHAGGSAGSSLGGAGSGGSGAGGDPGAGGEGEQAGAPLLGSAGDGATCGATPCVSASCDDGFIDGKETDIDCGGDCAPCATTRDCLVDADCASGACDWLAPNRCTATHCSDHHIDADESDVDCGGSCRPCGDGGFCHVDADCATNRCETDRGGLCLSAHCLDGVLDSSETDLDCGGGLCDGCALGQHCLLNGDCASRACDAFDATCIADHCADRHQDADETWIDCGGTTCAPCGAGGKCLIDGDCASGLHCATTNPHVCL